MAKTKISEFSSTPGNNTDIDGINIAEGCAPSGINNAIRELMSQLKDFQAGTAGDSFNGPVGTSTAAAGAFTTLTTSSTVTHNAGTANGVAYLNGSKVLTTGSALTFDGTNLAIGASPTFYGGQVATAGSIAITGGSLLKLWNTGGTGVGGISSPGTDTLSFSVGSGFSEQMRLTSTGLGIGTSSPTTRLTLKAGSNVSALCIVQDNNEAFGYSLQTDSSTGNFVFNRYASSDSALYTVSTSGNLGLGVTPSAWGFRTALQIGSGGSLAAFNGGASFASNIEISGNSFLNASASRRYIASDFATLYRQEGGIHSWLTAPSGTAGNAISFTQAMTLDASGNLGVGTTSPQSVLHVQGANNEIMRLQSSDATTGSVYFGYYDSTGNRKAYCGFGGSANDQFQIWNEENDAMVFATNNAERARIDTSGNLLVGKTSAGLATGVQLEPNGGSSFIRSSSSNSDLNLYVYSTGAGAARFYVGMGGTVFATSTSISAISDATLKENVRDLETGLTEVMALRPRRFDWKNGDAQDVAGFVAQEVEQVLPELVTDYVYNKDENGNDIIKKSLKMGDILPTLVNAIQEQQAIIEQLKARLDAANL